MGNNDIILQKITDMIDIMERLTDNDSTQCYNLIKQSSIYYMILSGDKLILAESPRSSLLKICKEMLNYHVKEGLFLKIQEILFKEI